MSSQERSVKALNAAVEALMDHFDTVQIFVSKTKDDNITTSAAAGSGNLYGRVGQIGLWLAKVENDILTGGFHNDDENPQVS